MLSRSTLLLALSGVPACYSGYADEMEASSTGAGTTPGTSAPGETSATSAITTTTGAPTTTQDPGTTTAPGTTDMSEGTGDSSTGAVVVTSGETTGGEPATTDTGATTMGETGETGEPLDEAGQLCARWNDDRAALGEGTWSGDVNSCNKGAVSQDGRDNTLRLVNLYRFIAGLPAVTEDPARSGKAQACALMMHANGTLNHNPPMDWKCWSAEGAEAAGQSNISGTAGVLGIDLYMVDPGNDTTIGHRRWILSNSLGPIGMGSTVQNSCLLVIGGNGNAGKAYTAWPPAGLVPLQALHVPTVGWSDVDKTGWTVQSDSIELGGATVSVKEGGMDRPVTVTVLGQGYGSSQAIRFVPQGWGLEAGKTYDVTLGGVSQAIAYSVTVVDCG